MGAKFKGTATTVKRKLALFYQWFVCQALPLSHRERVNRALPIGDFPAIEARVEFRNVKVKVMAADIVEGASDRTAEQGE